MALGADSGPRHIPHAYTEEVAGTGVPAWTHRAIGGITANVTPKFKADITVEPDRECKTGIGVRGYVRPGMADQTISVTVQPVGGEKFFLETKTDPGGRFQVCIDPRQGERSKANPWEGRAVGKMQGLYEVVCETVDAVDLAYAKSTPLYFDLRAGKRLPEPKPAAPAVAQPKPREVQARSYGSGRPAEPPLPAGGRAEHQGREMVSSTSGSDSDTESAGTSNRGTRRSSPSKR